MANEENLIPFDQRTENEQREIRSKGGKASGQSRREKKLFKDLFKEMLDDTETDLDGEIMVTRKAVVKKAVKYLTDPNIDLDAKDYVRVMEFIRDTIGEKPSDKVDLSIEDESARLAHEYFAEQYNKGIEE